MPFSWKETSCCPTCRKTITRISKKIGHNAVVRRSVIDWCRCNCEPIKDESLVDAKPLILKEEDLDSDMILK